MARPGMLGMILALLLLAAALAARNGRWRWVLPLLVLTLLQPVLAIAGAAGGLHVLNAAVILGIGGMLTYRAWRVDRVRQAEVPHSVVYDIRADQISALRIYFPISLLVEQLTN